MTRLGKSRVPISGESGETSLGELSKPSAAIIGISKDMRKVFPMEGHSSTIKGGALSMSELSEEIQARGLYEQVAMNEVTKQREEPEMISPTSPPVISGVSPSDSMFGYTITQKPYHMVCAKGHTIPSGAKVYTDRKNLYCPYCGSRLQIQ